MKIAALFVGRIKSYEATHASIMSRVFAGHDVDVFLSHNAYNTTDNVEGFRALYNAKRIEARHHDKPRDFFAACRNICGSTTIKNFWWHIHCLAHGMKMIESYSAETGVKYDAVIYLRADMHFRTAVPLPAEPPAPSTVYIPMFGDWGGICDQFAFGTPEAMRGYAATAENIHKYTYVNNVKVHPETMLAHNIASQGLTVVRLNFSADLDYTRK
jgi:hypothetical protein